MGEGLWWRWFIEWGTPRDAHMHAVKRVIYQGRSKYQEIEVIEFYELGKGLILDGKTQSTLYDEYVYHEALVHPAMIAHGSPRKVLVVGGGEGATLREVLRYKTVEEAHMVDLDEQVIEVARRYMPEFHQGSFDDPRAKLFIQDGRKFVSEREAEYDVIILDLVDPMEGGPASLLYTQEFYSLVKKALKPGGVVVTQATSPTFSLYAYAIIRNTLATVFRNSAPYMTHVRSFDGLWGFVVASDRVNPAELAPEEVDRRIATLIGEDLKFYDGKTHLWMFTLPKHIRRGLEEERRIATDSQPVFMPA